MEETLYNIRYTMYVCMPELFLKLSKDNCLDVLVIYAIVVAAAISASVAIGSRARSKRRRAERLACAF